MTLGRKYGGGAEVASAVSNRAHAAIDWKVHARDEARFVGARNKAFDAISSGRPSWRNGTAAAN
jgi:hypothetical protein